MSAPVVGGDWLAPRALLAVYAGAGTPRAAVVGVEGLLAPRSGERLIGVLPPIFPERLGDAGFSSAHGTRFPYVVGEMARGLSTPEMVIQAARAGILGFFGSAGLPVAESVSALRQIAEHLGPSRVNWGANLIHSPNEPDAELAFARAALSLELKAVSASAFMRLSPAIVLLAVNGLRRAPDGRVLRARRLLAKVSRAEVARQFLAPAPADVLSELEQRRLISRAELELARHVPVADDLTVEADSGGHTDNRPLTVLLPEMLALADQVSQAHGYARAPRVGAAGGLGTPAALAAAFAAGAAYVVTGSVNQCTVESGLSEDGRRLLAEADSSDVAMAPAADMFELGVKVQVLKRGTLFAQRGQRLYELYRRHAGLESLSQGERSELERTVLGRDLDAVWADTRAFFAEQAPLEVERAEREPKHKMALVFRWYLFMGAHWARVGHAARRADYQIWCGPAMGAFNAWVKGSCLEPIEQRSVVQIARNLLEGAAFITRAHALRQLGVTLPAGSFDFRPRYLE